MTIKSNVLIKIGDASGLTDFSDRINGATFSTDAPVGQFGRGTAVISMLNNDGALTPNAGGTYSSVDWFTQAVFASIDTGTYTAELFHGIISAFELLDDGVNSYVQITAMDGFSTGGAGTVEFNVASGLSGTVAAFIDAAFDGGTGATGYTLPLLGNPTSNCNVFEVGIATNTSVSVGTYSFSGRSKDWVNAVAMPCGPSMAWPTIIDLEGGPSDNRTDFEALTLQPYFVRDSTTKQDFVFGESAASGELPFRNMVRRYTNDDMVNLADVTFLDATPSGTTPDSVVSSNATSANKYGTRAVRFSEVLQSEFSGTPLGRQDIADRWANVFSSSEFVVREITLTETMVNAAVGSSAASEELWAKLLDVESGLCQVASVKFTPTGASTQQTETVVIVGRQIDISPSDIRIALTFLPGDQTGAFILDSSTLGVLDQNRLG